MREVEGREGEVEGGKGALPHGRPELALPHGDAMPAHCGEAALLSGVALAVACDFALPEVAACGGHAEVATPLVSVPEATVDKNHRSVSAQHDVGVARQAWVIEAVSVPPGEEILAHNNLGLGAGAVYCSHVAMPLWRHGLVVVVVVGCIH